MEYSWGHARRFNAYSNYFRKHFGERVQKLSIDAGFTCPNRDGKLGIGGCTYCNNNAFNPSYCNSKKSVRQQIIEGIEFHRKRYRRTNKYLAYFQPYSNTYAEISRLKQIYIESLQFPEIIGIVIGTRPDCVDDEKLEFLRKLSESYYIMIEYGIESCYDHTLKRINRGHSFEQSVEAIIKTAKLGIKTGGHIIFGLPGESREEMMNEASILSKLPLNNIKFHQLQIIKETQMAVEYSKNPESFNLFSLNDYIDFVCEFISYLSPNIVIERFAGEVPPRFLVGPNWGLFRNDQILNMIEKKLSEKNIWQGKYFNSL